jgi:integrase
MARKNSADALSPEMCELINSHLLDLNRDPIYAHIWRFGLNVPLRISDILQIQFKDIFLAKNDDGVLCQWLRIKEKKTGKYSLIVLNTPALKVIDTRRELWPEDTFVFEVHSNRASGKAISRVSVYNAFATAGNLIRRNVGCHSTRKSRGKLLYDNGVPLEQISKVLNHSCPAETMRYIGLEQKQIDDTYSFEMLNF